jgi:hypothetical protein
MKKAALFSLLIAVSTTMFAGGPWVQKKGNSYFKLSEWWLVFDEHYTSAGLKDPNVTTGVFNTFLYGEYGITDKFTGIVSSALFSRNYMNNLVSGTTGKTIVAGEAVNYLGDTDLGLKYQLSKKRC